MRHLLYCLLLALSLACARSEPPVPPLGFTGSLEFATPVANLHVNGGFPVQLRTTPEASRIDLFVDNEALAQLTSPYRYDFEPRQLAEGPHTLRAVASFENAEGEPHQLERSLDFVLDRVAPAMTSRFPAPGESFFRACGITVEFSEPILPSSLSVELRDDSGALHPVNVTLIDARTVNVNSDVPAVLPNTWSISLTVRDLAGNALAVEPWSLAVPRFQSTRSSALLYDKKLAMARNGPDVVLAYQVPSHSSVSVIYFGSLCRDEFFRAEEGAHAVALATAPDGTAYALHNGLHLHRLTGSRWGEPWLTVADAPEIKDSRLAIGQDGSMAMSWIPQKEDRCYRAGRVVAGVAEELPGLPCGPEGGRTSVPEAAVDGMGRPVFAWQEATAEGEATVRAVMWDSEWKPLGASMPNMNADPHVLSVDSMGRPVLAYGSPSLDGILVKVWTGTAWEDLPTLVAARSPYPMSLVTQGTSLLLVWAQYDSSSRFSGFEITASELRAGDTVWRTTDAEPFWARSRGGADLITDSADWSVLGRLQPGIEYYYTLYLRWNNASSL